MSTSEKRRGVGEFDGDREVGSYLQEHPEFFTRHPDLVRDLRIPHGCGDAVSLVEHQVAVLRDQAHQLRRKLQEMINNARDNEELNRRLHRLTLHLIECPDVDDVFAALYQSLFDDFNADSAVMRIFATPQSTRNKGLGEFVGKDVEAETLFEGVLKAARPVCGRLQAAQKAYLFGDRGSEIGSGALLQLGETERFGILAIGSRDPHRFHPGMGTSFLSNLSEIVSRVVAPHVADA